MASTKRRYGKEEFARRGDEMYENKVRPQLKTDDEGKFAAIDIESGMYEIAADELEACDRLSARIPEAQIWLVRVGSRYLHRFSVGGVVLIIGTILTVCTIIGGYLWFRPPTVFYFPDARVSYKTGGTDFTVTFLVRDAKGRPMQGVRVASDSYSGWTQYETTDDAGRAIVKPGEDEVTAVEVDGRIVHFRPKTWIEEELFLPHCAGSGLIVNVELAAKSGHPASFR